MHRGYIKLWRKSLESVVFNNEGLLKVWIWCLLKATHKEMYSFVESGKSGVEAKVYPGQFVFGKYSASKELRMNPSTVYKRIQKLKNIGNLNLESNHQYTIISINNWYNYQQEEIKSNYESNHQVTTKEPLSNTDKNNKNNKHNKINKDNGFELPEWIPKTEWYGYMEVRGRIKCANTSKAKQLLVNKLQGFKNQGYSVREILEEATEKSWKSVYLPKNKETISLPIKTEKDFSLPENKTCSDCGFFDRCRVYPSQRRCSIAIKESKFYDKGGN